MFKQQRQRIRALVDAPALRLWRMRDRDFYRQLARTLVRAESITHDELLGFLIGAGYEKQATCEMPGQFAVRGGIVDIFSPEALQPVRVDDHGTHRTARVCTQCLRSKRVTRIA